MRKGYRVVGVKCIYDVFAIVDFKLTKRIHRIPAGAADYYLARRIKPSDCRDRFIRRRIPFFGVDIPHLTGNAVNESFGFLIYPCDYKICKAHIIIRGEKYEK